jgi:branched-chain amino acid transport system substrate-binding protein
MIFQGGEMPEPRSLSRRAFLKATGVAGVGIGLSGGLGGLVAGCSAGGESTTSSASTATTGGATATSGGVTATTVGDEATTTSVSPVDAATEIKIGYAVPATGSMADRGATATWLGDWFGENVWKDGIEAGDGKKYRLAVVFKDTQSDAARASQVAQDLIAGEKVALVAASGGETTVIPVRDAAESGACPCVTCDCPGDVWNAAQPEDGFNWSWHTWYVFRDVALNYIAMWDAVQTNKKIGGLYPDDPTGNLFASGLPPAFEAKGYSYFDPGRYKDGTRDFTAIISQFQKEGVEVVNGVPTPADFAAFWKQAVQQGFRPKMSTQAGALLLPAGIDALGELGDGQTVECWFHPTFPYTSSLLSVTPKQVCDQWEQDTGSQWTQPLGLFAQFEVLTDVVQRCTDPLNKDAIVEAIKGTKVVTVGGPVDWTTSPDPYSGLYNFCAKPITGGQWVKGTGKWPYDLNIVVSATQPEVATTSTTKELTYPA